MIPSLGEELILYVAPNGNNKWSGRLPEPTSDGNDGPLADPVYAINRLRKLRGKISGRDLDYHVGCFPGRASIVLREGRYTLSEPIVLTPQDSGAIRIVGYPGEKVILDGGIRLTGWQEENVGGKRIWKLSLSDEMIHRYDFSQLFVNGRRAQLPRYPREGTFLIKDALTKEAGWGKPGTWSCYVDPQEVGILSRPQEVEMVALHYWIEEHLPIKTYDPRTGYMAFTRRSRAPLTLAWDQRLAPYYLLNVREAFGKPGDFYLDRETKVLQYIPRDDENLDSVEIYCPYLAQLVRLDGNPEQNRWVSGITFENLIFEHTRCIMPGDERFSDLAFIHRGDRCFRGSELGSSNQAAVDVPAVVQLVGAKECSFIDCTFRHLGWYAIEVERGCFQIRIIGNEIYDSAAGGIKINGATPEENPLAQTSYILISDNHLHDLGTYFHAAVGVLSRHAAYVVIRHNSIHDLYYSGVSVGWTWGYADSVCRGNVIEYNHIYNLGKGILSDMGGIYTLGYQPGTIIRNNLIHDIVAACYGGWAIYPDEGSNQVIIENNVCYRTNCSLFHQHYGRENVIRNNIFAFSDEGCVSLSRAEQHLSFTMYRNILLSRGKPIYTTGYAFVLGREKPFDSHMNLLWDYSGTILLARNKQDTTDIGGSGKYFSWEEWQKMGYDVGSLIADPRFKNPEEGDFTLLPDSPVYQIGFQPIDLSKVGPRPKPERDTTCFSVTHG